MNLPELPPLSIPVEDSSEKIFAYCDITVFNSPAIKTSSINMPLISVGAQNSINSVLSLHNMAQMKREKNTET